MLGNRGSRFEVPGSIEKNVLRNFLSVAKMASLVTKGKIARAKRK